MNTAAVSPYSRLFALLITSSIVLNFRMGCTGPKIYNGIARTAVGGVFP